MAHENPGFVVRQYRNASKLGARISLHERFSTNPRPWQRWVFDNLDLPQGSRVLEVGCGPGNLWLENRDRLPEGCRLTLTDASPGMLQAAKERLGSDDRFRFLAADVRDLPFEDGAFDAVVANHMLYHVPDRDRAFSEIARVLEPDGVFHAATNGESTHKEMAWMRRILDPPHPDENTLAAPLPFSLENGADQLAGFFGEVSVRLYEDALVVTEARPLVDYLLSGRASEETAGEGYFRRTSKLEEKLEKELAEHGGIRITKDGGMFAARK